MFRMFLALAALIMLAACGEGQKNAPGNDTVLVGMFVDSTVTGLTYKTDTLSGVTNERGEFQYKQGEQISFEVNNVMLGNAPAKGIITPIDLVPGAQNERQQMVVKILRVLQALDENDNPSDGIVIPVALRGSSQGKPVDLQAALPPSADDKAIEDFIIAFSKKSTVPTRMSALKHFQGTLRSMGQPTHYRVGGQVIGLQGQLTLSLHPGAVLKLDAAGEFQFDSELAQGASYDVAIDQQPENQTCILANSAGKLTNLDVTNVMVFCQATKQTNTVDSAGVDGTVVVTDAAGQKILVNNSGSFTFTSKGPATNDSQNLALETIPAYLDCQFEAAPQNGKKLVCNADYTINVNVTGLKGRAAIQNGENFTLLLEQNKDYVFPIVGGTGATFHVTVLNQPVGQQCEVKDATGNVVKGQAINVSVVCQDVVLPSYAISGRVSGLKGTLALRNNANELAVTQNGAFTFSAQLHQGEIYAVALVTNPVGQVCTLPTNVSGTITGAVDIGEIVCADKAGVLYVEAANLTGELQLALNGTEKITRSTAAEGVFTTQFVNGQAYHVSIDKQPVGQTCAFINNSEAGSYNSAIKNAVKLACTSLSYSVGGSIGGLVGTLTLGMGSETKAIVGGNTFEFQTKLLHNTPYTVSIVTQPAGQSCSFSNSKNIGTIKAANVSDIAIACSTLNYTLGGKVSGLTGSLTLSDNLGDSKILAANGNFTFPKQYAHGSTYTSTIAAQPTNQLCRFNNGSNTGVATASAQMLAAIDVSCAATYVLGGTSAGLKGTVKLSVNGAASESVSANGAFTLGSRLAAGTVFAVSVTEQPASQTCTLANASSTMPVGGYNTVAVTCTDNVAPTFFLGGQITGLAGSIGLNSGAGFTQVFNANGSFQFATKIVQGTAYALSVSQQPVGQLCTVNAPAGSGTMGAADISTLGVTCVTQKYSLKGTITGLIGTLTLKNNGTSVGDFTRANSQIANPVFEVANVPYNTAYMITVAQPTGQTCTVSANGTGNVPVGGVAGIAVVCSTNQYKIAGKVSGLEQAKVDLTIKIDGVLLETKSIDTTNLVGDVAFVSTNSYAYGANYALALGVPAGKSCAINGAATSGTVPVGGLSNLVIACTTLTYKIGGTLSGLLAGTSVQLSLNNDSELLQVASNGGFQFNSALKLNDPSTVTIKTQPVGQSCTLTDGRVQKTTPVGGYNGILVACTATSYKLSGTVTGLLGTLSLQNGTETIAVQKTAPTFEFNVKYQQAYSVTVKDPHPAGQLCRVQSGATGTMPNGNLSNVVIVCDGPYTLGGSISGLGANKSVVLQNNGGENLTVTNTTASPTVNFAFPTGKAPGSSYAVTVLTQPANQSCQVQNNSGQSISANVSSVLVACKDLYDLDLLVTGLNTTITINASYTSSITNLLVSQTPVDIATNDNNTAFLSQVPAGSFYSLSVSFPGAASQKCDFSPAQGSLTANTQVTLTCENRKRVDDSSLYHECKRAPVDGFISQCINKTAFFECAKENSRIYGYTYIDEVRNLDCKSKGIDDPMDVELFKDSLETLDIGGNPLREATDQLFGEYYPRLERLNVFPNERIPELTIDVKITGVAAQDLDAVLADLVDDIELFERYSREYVRLDVRQDITPRPELPAVRITRKLWGYGLDLSLFTSGQSGYDCSVVDTSNLDDRLTRGNGYIYETEISCVKRFSLNGDVTGLNGQITLVNDRNEQLVLDANANFQFSSNYNSGDNFTVSAVSRTPGQTCTVSPSVGSFLLDSAPPRVHVVCKKWDFLAGPKMPDARSKHSVVAVGQKIYLIGGTNAVSRSNNSVFIFDTVTGQWSTGPSLLKARRDHTSVVLNDKIYVIGGVDNGDTTLSSVEVLDTAAGVSAAWSQGVELPAPRAAHGSAVLSGEIYVVAGNDGIRSYGTTYRFRPSLNAWDGLASLNVDRSYVQLSVLNNELVVAGGGAGTSLASVEKYDSNQRVWKIAPTLTTPRMGYASTVLNNELVVVGGYNIAGLGYLNSMEIYSGQFGRWFNVDGLPVELAYGALVTVDGGLYYFGGLGPAGLVDSTYTIGVSRDIAQSVSPNLQIPDSSSAGIISNLYVDAPGIAINSNLQVDINISHTFIGDLTVVLTSPQGASVTLHNRAGSNADNIVGSYPSTLTPFESLTSLIGAQLGGTWTLKVVDSAAADIGTLGSWGIRQRK